MPAGLLRAVFGNVTTPTDDVTRPDEVYLKIDGRLVYLWRAVGLLKAASKPSQLSLRHVTSRSLASIQHE